MKSKYLLRKARPLAFIAWLMFIHGGKTKGADKREFRFQGAPEAGFAGATEPDGRKFALTPMPLKKLEICFLFQWLTYMYTRGFEL